MNTARLMWTLYEPVHAVTYFSPEALGAFEAAGLRGFWRGYFAGRAAPLGPVGPAPVVATFFNFAPPMVARAIPDVWHRAAPDTVLRVRSEGASAALARLAADLPAAVVAEAADLLTVAASNIGYAGRVLAAANAALPVPDEPLARLWQAATTLREHRGDGHVAALVATGLSGCEVLVWRASHDLTREVLQPYRGWTDEEWEVATRRLQERDWLDADARPTMIGVDAFAAIEQATDRAADDPWSDVDTVRFRTLIAPLSAACRDSLPAMNPIGLPTA